MRVAITGAAGHIGNNLCRELLKCGHQVTALVYKDTKSLEGLPIDLEKGDISTPETLDKFLENADIVCHLAALISIDGDKGGLVHQFNVVGTHNVIESCKRQGVKRLYYASSIQAHKSAPSDGILNEQQPYSDASDYPYNWSKAEAELKVIDARKQGLETTIFNPTAVIGPFDFKPSYSGQFIWNLCKGKLPSLTPLGFDWVDVRDVAWAIAEAIDRNVKNEKFFISGKWHSFKDFANLVAKYSGKSAPSFIAPFWLSRLSVPFVGAFSKLAGKEPMYNHESLDAIVNGCKNVDHKHAAEVLNYQPRPLEQTLQDTVSWFVQHNQL